jgi:hypothetical protein
VAYIRKAGSKWRVQVERQGVRKSASFDTKSEASQWAAHEESAILSAARGHYPRRTFAEAVDEYLSRVSVRKRSLKWERNAFARLATHFGDKALIRDIDEAKVAGWRDARLQTVSGSTVQREANLLRNLFTVARDEWKWIGHSPFKGVKLPAENQPRHQVWRWPLVKRVLRAHRTGKTAEMQRAFHIALRTGMRLSEVLQAPAGFDARRRVVVLASSKTTGRVEVPVGRIAARLLTGAAFTVNANEGSVLFGKLCRELLIEDLTFHDARATALTLCRARSMS